MERRPGFGDRLSLVRAVRTGRSERHVGSVGGYKKRSVLRRRGAASDPKDTCRVTGIFDAFSDSPSLSAMNLLVALGGGALLAALTIFLIEHFGGRYGPAVKPGYPDKRIRVGW